MRVRVGVRVSARAAEARLGDGALQAGEPAVLRRLVKGRVRVRIRGRVRVRG